jgi:hypothetical protein
VKTVSCWNDLQPFGIIPLTGEACGLMYRILFDVTEEGRKIVAKCFGFPRDAKLGGAWNRGTAEDPHVGSIMLTQEALVPLAVFALLENGCKEVYLMGDAVLGIEPGDPADTADTMRRVYKVEYARRFSYGGTAGDRNVHQMSGRVE